MKIKVENFCNLATNHSWQSWLYNLDQQLYKEFINKLSMSKGCNSNKDLMIGILRKIEDMNLGWKLENFLINRHPNMIQKTSNNLKIDEIFPNYRPGIITFPRRYILEGSQLQQKIEQFIANKLKSDYIIIENKAYIEYLNKNDENIENQISSDSWLIKKLKLSTKK